VSDILVPFQELETQVIPQHEELPSIQLFNSLDLSSRICTNRFEGIAEVFPQALQQSILDEHELGRQITELRERQRRLCEDRAKLTSLMAPIRRLPDEILIKIFSLARWPITIAFPDDKPYVPYQPCLELVCSY
jgi:hypothetical protein